MLKAGFVQGRLDRDEFDLRVGRALASPTYADLAAVTADITPARVTGARPLEPARESVAEPTAHLVTAIELYGPAIKALQVVHADKRGHWPWDAEYRGVQGGQPVLGIRASHPVRAV